MGTPDSDPVATTIAWFRAHEFGDVDRVTPGSNVLAADGLRARVWAVTPSEADLSDTVAASPDGSWCALVFLNEPESGLLRSEPCQAAAAFLLEPDGHLRALNALAHDLVEGVAARQHAKSFATRALSLLQSELGGAGPEEAEQQPPEQRGLPARPPGKGVHEVPPSPQMAAQAAVEEPPPEPDPSQKEAADEERMRRIEEMRSQRALRKSVKHR